MVRKVSTKKSKKIKGDSSETLVLNCTACDIPQLLVQGKRNILCHSTLHVAICRECLMFSNCDIVPLDDEGYEIYCRWCSELGDLVCCDRCKAPYCKECIVRNFDEDHYNNITEQEDWSCYGCDPAPINDLRIVTKAALNFQNFMEPSEVLLERCARKFSGEEITDSDREEIIRERIKLRRNAMAKVEIQRNEAKESDEDEEEDSDNKSVDKVEKSKAAKKSDKEEENSDDDDEEVSKKAKKSDKNSDKDSDKTSDKSVASDDEVAKDRKKSDDENSDKKSEDSDVEIAKKVKKSDSEKSKDGSDQEEDDEKENSEDEAPKKKKNESRKRSKDEESDDEEMSEPEEPKKKSSIKVIKLKSTSEKSKKKKKRF